ncbi:MAG: transcription elongation factor GreA [Aerococcus sp.]|nr:transcription elongation factor GreA [Aerococcus sp.]
MTKHQMTAEGKRNAEEKLAYLKNVRSKELLERMKNARGNSDIPINSDFTLAKDELKYTEDQIKELELTLDNVEIIEEDSAESTMDTVAFGTTVTFKEVPDGDEEQYKILGKMEADPAKGIISDESPIAKALMDKHVGDTVTIQLPEDTLTVEILNVELID